MAPPLSSSPHHRAPKLRTQPSSTFTVLSCSSQATSSHISTGPEQDDMFASNIQGSNNACEQGSKVMPSEKSLLQTERVPASPPPSYDDPIHPWAMCGRDRSSSSACDHNVDNEDKEEEETLPPYVCTISRAGRVYIKKEMDSPQKKAKKRSWK